MKTSHIALIVAGLAVVGLYFISRGGAAGNAGNFPKAIPPPPALPQLALSDPATGKALAFSIVRPNLMDSLHANPYAGRVSS